MREPASREIISASLELYETEVCFLHIQLIGTNVWLPKMYRIPPDIDFESSTSLAKSESWNNAILRCCAVFPTLQYCRYSLAWWMYEIKRAKRLSQDFCPFCDHMSKFIHRPQNIRSPNTSQTQTFHSKLWANCWQFSNWSYFFFLKMVVIKAWCCDFVWLLSCFIRMFAISFHTFLGMTFNVIGPRSYCFCIWFPWSSGR